VLAIERGPRTMAELLILRSKGYPRVHVGAGRVAGPGAAAWLSVLRWASEDLLVDIGLNAARHPDVGGSASFFLARTQRSLDQPQDLPMWTIPKSACHTRASV
jgi:hypothetical protein